MELKTYKEFKQGGDNSPSLLKIEVKEEIEVEEESIYLLQHPDIEWVQDGFYDPEGMNIELKDGYVKVNETIKDILMNRGFIFIKELKDE